MIILPIADKYLGAWYRDWYPEYAAYTLINSGVDTPDTESWVETEWHSDHATCEFYMATPGTANIITAITARAYVISTNTWQTWDIEFYDTYDNLICGEYGLAVTDGILSANATGEWGAVDLSGSYIRITAKFGESEPQGKIFELDCLLTVSGEAIPIDTVRNETLFRLTLSGDSVDRTNWVELFDNTVWTGNAKAIWNISRWDIQVGSKFGTNYACITAAGTDFDTFRPTKFKVSFAGAETLDITTEYSDSTATLFAQIITGRELMLNTSKQVIAIYFSRSNIYELYPYITDIEFYDADFVPTVNEDAVIPLSNCNITFRIEMKDANGETLPAWESASSPFSNGYDSEKCLYRINFTGTAPSLNHAADFVANAGNELIFEYSIQTGNGEQDWHELTFFRAELQSATAQEGAQSQSITFQAEKESLVSDYTWDYQEVDISGVSFRSPNQTGGKWTYNMAGLITGIKPGYKATYNGQSFIVGEIQYIINTTGIQTYLKEY